jgi:hypothetical protein
LKLGPLALVTGLIQGKQVAEILLAAEEDWLIVDFEGDKYEYEKADLE